MMLRFADQHDGLYDVEVEGGTALPVWLEGMSLLGAAPVEDWNARAVPQQVSRFQARAALLQADLLDDIEAYMALDTTDAFTKLAWKDAQDFNRSSPLVEAIGQLIGLTPAQLDDLFVFASTITA